MSNELDLSAMIAQLPKLGDGCYIDHEGFIQQVESTWEGSTGGITSDPNSVRITDNTSGPAWTGDSVTVDSAGALASPDFHYPDQLLLAGERTYEIPLPKKLGALLLLCQGRGIRITQDHQPLTIDEIAAVEPDKLVLTIEVRNLRVWLKDEVWEWDSAGEAWFSYRVER
jgi:hypothetical protein